VQNDTAATDGLAESPNAAILGSIIPTIIEAMPDYVLVLDTDRRILAANNRLLQAFGIADPRALLGLRPGNALNCIHADETPAGCGAGKHCQKCAAVLALIESEEANTQVSKEYRVTIAREQWFALDLEVLVTPLAINNTKLTLFAMRDISAEKRRSALEQVFFHDVINTAGGIRGLATVLADGKLLEPAEETHYKQWIVTLTDKLVEEILYQRNLLAAEKGEFKPNREVIDVGDLLREEHALYANHPAAVGRRLVLGATSECRIMSDATILRKILGNLLKNALEATPEEGTVTLSCREEGDNLAFLISNPGVIPADVQLQIFQRSFSTKSATGRGLGTYSIKLFGERYLRGKVSFTSRAPEGTIFRFSLPKN
jgi:signal transduction histidine kinase